MDQTDNTKICYESYADITLPCPYYYMKKNGAYKCLSDSDSCLAMKYNYLLGKECRKECDDYYKLEDIDTSLNLIQCFETKDACLSFDSGSPKYYNIKLKRCWITLPYGYYIITIESGSKYEVVKECQKYYFKDSNIENNYHCIEKCSVSGTHLHFYKEEKNCEMSCKPFNKHYKDPYTYECLDTCIGRKSGTTYIEFADEVDYTITNPEVVCKEKCDDDQHYNYGTKICITGTNCGDFNKFNKEGEAEHVCYNSCDEIPDVSKIYEADNTCYEESLIISTLCPYYYKKGYKTLKCVNSEADCINAGYNYLHGKECIKNCDNYYKLIDGNNIIKCYDNYEIAFEENREFKFYDIILKQCWKTFPSGYFVKYVNNNGENYEIVSECEKYYYLNSDDHNYCVDNCKDMNLYFIQQNKKCEDSCLNPDINKLYFDKDNHECLDTCVGKINFEYDFRNITVANTPQKCISKCPKRHFITTTDDNGLTHYECVDECPFDSAYTLLDNKTKECLSSCPDDKYIEVNNTCYPKCDLEKHYSYISTDTYDCLKACPSE